MLCVSRGFEGCCKGRVYFGSHPGVPKSAICFYNSEDGGQISQVWMLTLRLQDFSRESNYIFIIRATKMGIFLFT